MKKEVFLEIDDQFSLLKRLTDEKKAGELLKNFVMGKGLGGGSNETKFIICFKGRTKNEIISQIAKFGLIYSSKNDVPSSEVFDNFKKQLLNSKINYNEVVSYLLENNELLNNLVNEFVTIKSNYSEPISFDYDTCNSKIKRYIINLALDGKSDVHTSVFGKIRNLVFNKSRQDIMNDKQVKIEKKNYSLGKELYATIDRGNSILSQEDGVLLLKHPDDKRFKLIAVADGESSLAYGEKASNFALSSLIKWFENLDWNYYQDDIELKKVLENQLIKINSELENAEKRQATTIAVAIVTRSHTVISTIGDSRIYLVKDNKIIGETKDDSYVQTLCDKGLADPKKARYHKAIDILNNQLGKVEFLNVIVENTKIVSNDKYDKLIILSDGVTRLVDNDKIEKILDNNKKKENKITEELVKVAKTEDSYTDGLDLYCNNKIEANQNNMTAAMYIKRR